MVSITSKDKDEVVLLRAQVPPSPTLWDLKSIKNSHLTVTLTMETPIDSTHGGAKSHPPSVHYLDEIPGSLK